MADLIPVYPDSEYDAVYISRNSDTNAILANERRINVNSHRGS